MVPEEDSDLDNAGAEKSWDAVEGEVRFTVQRYLPATPAEVREYIVHEAELRYRQAVDGEPNIEPRTKALALTKKLIANHLGWEWLERYQAGGVDRWQIWHPLRRELHRLSKENPRAYEALLEAWNRRGVRKKIADFLALEAEQVDTYIRLSRESLWSGTGSGEAGETEHGEVSGASGA